MVLLYLKNTTACNSLIPILTDREFILDALATMKELHPLHLNLPPSRTIYERPFTVQVRKAETPD